MIICLSVYFGQKLEHSGSPSAFDYEALYRKSVTFISITTINFYICNLYDFSSFKRKRELLARIIPCFIVISFIVVAINFIFPYMNLSRISYIVTLSLLIPSIIFHRFIYHFMINMNKFKEKIIVIGTRDIAKRLLFTLKNYNNTEYEILGFVAEDAKYFHEDEECCPVIGTIKDLKAITKTSRPDVVVVALSEMRGAFPSNEILNCKLQGIRVEDWPTFYEKLTGKIVIQNLRPSWIIFADGFTRNNLTGTVKRLIDVLLSVLGLCFSFPLMIIIGIMIKIDSPGPIFFRQERVGENGKIFTLIKFRTMVADAEKNTGPVWSQSSDPRVTKLGKLFRRTGMDEIPQLFNVLQGDMSFVGPRPERPHFVAELQEKIPYYSQRLAVRPGVTGWAQVRYGYGATVIDAIEKLEYDLYYIKNMSIFLDFLIILSTIHKVVFAKVSVQTETEGNTWLSYSQQETNTRNLASIEKE